MTPTLDDKKRRTILALISNGSSRRIAARFVGCAPSTITRTADRDPFFAEQLASAENMVEVKTLQAIQNAAQKDRYWRAAAWLLERRNPEDFCRRSPELFTFEQIENLLANLRKSIVHIVPQKLESKILQKFRNAKKELRPQKSGDSDQSNSWEDTLNETLKNNWIDTSLIPDGPRSPDNCPLVPLE